MNIFQHILHCLNIPYTTAYSSRVYEEHPGSREPLTMSKNTITPYFQGCFVNFSLITIFYGKPMV